MSHDAWVLDRMCDCYVSVHADGHQVEDGGGACPQVHRQPDEAQFWPNTQVSNTSYTAESGRTNIPSSRSATARDKIS